MQPQVYPGQRCDVVPQCDAMLQVAMRFRAKATPAASLEIEMLPGRFRLCWLVLVASCSADFVHVVKDNNGTWWFEHNGARWMNFAVNHVRAAVLQLN